MKTQTGVTLTQPIYDTVQFAAAGVLPVNFFQVPYNGLLGTPAVKGYAQTNLIQAGELEAGHFFTIEAISMFFHPNQPAGGDTTADRQALWDGVMELRIQQTEFLKVPMAMIPDAGANERFIYEPANAGAAEVALHNLMGLTQAKFYLEEKLTLEPQQNFRVVVSEYTAATNDTNLTCVLWGTLRRPVV